ncbi:MAG: type I-E CRISPR-associated protein Cas7/Cse4/CasC [Myxococcales bacterium]
MDADQRKAVLDAFLRAALLAVPGARKNSMNAATLPHAVLGIRKDKGQPLQLVNAFEAPVRANGEAVAVVQATRLGLTAIFHIVDIVESDLNVVVNKLLVTEAKAMGANRVDLKSANTSPRHGIFALTGGIIGVTFSQATGVAVK